MTPAQLIATPGVSSRTRAKTAPESPLIHWGLRRVMALPSRAVVPRKPMCRQTLGGSSVPPPSILLPILPPLSTDSCADRHASHPLATERAAAPTAANLARFDHSKTERRAMRPAGKPVIKSRSTEERRARRKRARADVPDRGRNRRSAGGRRSITRTLVGWSQEL